MWPDAADDLQSMRIHAEKYFRPMTTAVKPDLEQREYVLGVMEEWYKPCIWQLPDDFLSRDRFLGVLRRLDFSSSPGYPYCREKQTIGEWLGFDGFFLFDETQVEILWHDVNLAIGGQSKLIQRVFIKPEPHKKAKAEEGRWRLIMSFPLNHQVLWHMLFDFMNDLEIRHATEIPSQQGIQLFGGAWKGHLRRWKQAGYDTGLDKSAWDWTFMYWLLEWDLQFRYRMGRGRMMEEWWRLAEQEWSLAFGQGSLFITTKGFLLRQEVPGIMKSGSVVTISTNSHAQAMLHILVCRDECTDPEPFPACCGDDTLQRLDQASVLGYRKYGAIVKSASDGLEFVGHEFTDLGPQPLYMEKHFNRFIHIDEKYLPEYLDAMSRLYVKTPYFGVWSALADIFGCSVPSRQKLLNFYDYSC